MLQDPDETGETWTYPGNTTTLGCELQFVQTNTLQVLADLIQHALSANQRYYVIAGQLKGEVKAIRELRNRNNLILPQAFAFCTEIRHAPVEDGAVGETAWRSCRQLQIVHLPDTVVSLLHGVFSWCQSLRAVVAPGCKYFRKYFRH